MQARNTAIDDLGAFELIEKVLPEFLVRDAVSDSMIGNDEDRMCDSENGFHVTATSLNTVKLIAQIGLGMSCEGRAKKAALHEQRTAYAYLGKQPHSTPSISQAVPMTKPVLEV